ncbi:hypothetical protein SDC14_14485 [Legionella pneumophila serogroup 1]|uniref:Uncharacterized protein n=1 Tax=Legionella moravica TaxID=39962 RepID=A0A378JXD5_9GAMM|nr:hypothetical protein [Legionella moravica]HAT7052199.1 hypothetical protein [Legionella pneumophila]KTD35480.1 hypothetical protein Lmor_0927 [Legionella moravica]STX62068.1 Uncharacterised protein [Legionella moravica]HAT7054451.1 hypothetical protein [Legionella pneumophila]HAT7064344.1 hypothetical protein [Legionella pneumophila]
MNLLDVIEKAVGSEYFENGDSELYIALQKADANIGYSSNQLQQPHANKIVLIK